MKPYVSIYFALGVKACAWCPWRLVFYALDVLGVLAVLVLALGALLLSKFLLTARGATS